MKSARALGIASDHWSCEVLGEDRIEDIVYIKRRERERGGGRSFVMSIQNAFSANNLEN